MPIYEIAGKRVEADNPLSDDEIDEIAESFASNESSTISSDIAPVNEPGRGLEGIAKGFGGRLADVGSMLASPITTPLKGIQKAYGGIKASLAGEDTSQFKDSFSDSMRMTGLSQFGEMAKGSLEAAAEQASLIGQEEGLGRKLGRAALVPLAAFPLTGASVASGEKIAAGNTEGYGEAFFDLGTAIIPEAAARIPSIPGASRLGTRLQKNAPKQFAEGLYPKLKNEHLALQVAEEALDRGIWGRMSSLEKEAAKIAGIAGPEIEKVLAGSSKRLNPKALGLDVLEELANSEKVGGLEQGIRSLEDAAQSELARLPEDVSLLEAQKMRQIKEDPLVRKNAYSPGADPQLSANVEAQGRVADSLREALAEAEPSAPMKDYNFAKKLEKLVKDPKKTTGLRALIDVPVAGAALADLVVTGGGLGIGAGVARALKLIHSSTAFKTGSALLKSKIGKYLESGNIPQAAKLAQIELPEELRAPEIWEGIERPINEMQGSRGQNSVVLDRLEAEGLPSTFDRDIPSGVYGIDEVLESAPELTLPNIYNGLDQAELPIFRQESLEPIVPTRPYLGTGSRTRVSSQAPRLWGDEVPKGFQEVTPQPRTIKEPKFPSHPERAQTLEEAAFTRAESPEVDFRSGPVPEIRQELPMNQFGILDEVQNSLPKGIIPEEAAATVMQELDNIGYQPEAIPASQLDPKRLKALEEADKKSLDAIIRTIQNPTYQKLPIKALKEGQKTKANVIKEIFLRNRKLALGKKGIE